MLARIWVFFLALVGSAFGANTSNVDFTITYTLSDVRFDTGPNAGTSALGGGNDYEFSAGMSYGDTLSPTEVGVGSQLAMSEIMVNAAPFDPDNDSFLEGDEFQLTLSAASSADTPGSTFRAYIEGQAEFYADIYTSEGLEFIWDYTYNVTSTVDNNDPDGGGSLVFADARVDWLGEITPPTTLPFIDLGYGDLCCGTPTNPGEAGSGTLALALAPGEFVAAFSFVAEAEAVNNDIIPEPRITLLAIAGGLILVLRRRRC